MVTKRSPFCYALAMDKYELARQIETLAGHANGAVREHLQGALDQLLRNGHHGLTDKDLKALPPGAIIRDPTVPGLQANHSKRQGIIWQLRIRGARNTRHLLGRWPETPPEAARQLARDFKSGKVAAANPTLRPAESGLQGVSKPVTLGRCVRRYLNDYPFGSTSNARHSKGNLEKLVALSNDPPIHSLTRSAVRDLLVRIERSRGSQAATKTRNALSRCWQFCQGGLPEKRLTADEVLIDPDLGNPAIGIKFAASKEKWPLSAKELDNLWVNLWHLAGVSEVAKDAIALMMLTASRVNEVCGIRSEWVNLTDGYIEIPSTKMKGEHRLQLVGEGLRIVKKHHDPVSPWLFPAARGEGHIHENTISGVLREHAKQLGIERTGSTLAEKGPANTHSVRRFAFTYLQEQGVDQRVIDRLVNHRPRGLQKTYGWSSHLWPQVREALELLDQRLIDAMLYRP